MKPLRGYLSLMLLLVLALSCRGSVTNSTPAPDTVSNASSTSTDTASNIQPTPTTASQTVPGAFPAEAILSITGDSTPFHTPTGIDIDSQGNIYVADQLNHRVLKFDSNGKPLSQGDSFGSGPDKYWPSGIAVDGRGNVFVTDMTGNRVRKFDSDGKPLTEWGEYGTGDAQFFHPAWIAVDAAGNLYVLDSENHRVQKFDNDGKFLTTWGSLGDQDGQFHGLTGIAIDSQGNVYVSGEGGAANIPRISIFDNTGKFLKKWEHIKCLYGIYENKGMGGLWFDSENRLFMGMAPPGVCVLDQDGNILGTWGTKGTAGELSGPSDLVGDNAGNIYVVEYSNNRIQKFRIK